jgi:hypothetical protein
VQSVQGRTPQPQHPGMVGRYPEQPVLHFVRADVPRRDPLVEQRHLPADFFTCPAQPIVQVADLRWPFPACPGRSQPVSASGCC